MTIRQLRTPQELEAYDQWVKTHPHGTLWQSLEYKAYTEALGKETRIYAAMDTNRIHASALVIIDKTSFGLCTWEMGRGPLEDVGGRGKGEGIQKLLHKILEDARQEKCICLYLSPQKNLPPTPYPLTLSGRHKHCEATRIIDLTQTEEEILAQMKQKGRYNIKVAEKNGVYVKQSDDVDAFYALAQETGKRDGFGILPKRHYEAFLRCLPHSFLLLAFRSSESSESSASSLPAVAPSRAKAGDSCIEKPIAALLGTIWNNRGIYYYGASSHAHRALMAPYVLQWEAMRHCKSLGCTSYDLLGIAPPGAAANHPWQGITGFKEKFGGRVETYETEKMVVLRRWAHAALRIKRQFLG